MVYRTTYVRWRRVALESVVVIFYLSSIDALIRGMGRTNAGGILSLLAS